MADQRDGSRVVFHAREASRWTGSHPLLDRHLAFVRRGFAPNYRWTGGDIEGLYTSHDPEVAFAEVAQYLAPDSLLGSDLADTGDRPLIRVGSFAPLPATRVYDGRSAGFMSDPAMLRCLAPAPQGHDAGRAMGRRLVLGARRYERLIVPSAPAYARGEERWNSVFIIGTGFVPSSALPSIRSIELSDPRPAW